MIILLPFYLDDKTKVSISEIKLKNILLTILLIISCNYTLINLNICVYNFKRKKIAHLGIFNSNYFVKITFKPIFNHACKYVYYI